MLTHWLRTHWVGPKNSTSFIGLTAPGNFPTLSISLLECTWSQLSSLLNSLTSPRHSLIWETNFLAILDTAELFKHLTNLSLPNIKFYSQQPSKNPQIKISHHPPACSDFAYSSTSRCIVAQKAWWIMRILIHVRLPQPRTTAIGCAGCAPYSSGMPSTKPVQLPCLTPAPAEAIGEGQNLRF